MMVAALAGLPASIIRGEYYGENWGGFFTTTGLDRGQVELVWGGFRDAHSGGQGERTRVRPDLVRTDRVFEGHLFTSHSLESRDWVLHFGSYSDPLLAAQTEITLSALSDGRLGMPGLRERLAYYWTISWGGHRGERDYAEHHPSLFADVLLLVSFIQAAVLSTCVPLWALLPPSAVGWAMTVWVVVFLGVAAAALWLLLTTVPSASRPHKEGPVTPSSG